MGVSEVYVIAVKKTELKEEDEKQVALNKNNRRYNQKGKEHKKHTLKN